MVLPDLVTFLSDFGPDSGYPAACELMIARRTPAIRVIHLTHSIPPGDVRRGAHLLRLLLPHGPVAVHLAIVDPGVGSSRRALCLACGRGDHLVGPDNGLLLPAAADLGGVRAAWSLSVQTVRAHAGLTGPPSQTFHGRDVFAPAAALLAAGEPPDALGDRLHPQTLARPAEERPAFAPDRLIARVSEIDPFGNVQLHLKWSELQTWLAGQARQGVTDPVADLGEQTGGGARVNVTAQVNAQIHFLTMVRTYADLERDELGLLADSWGLTTIARRDARAADAIGVGLHDTVALLPAKPQCGHRPVPQQDRTGAL